MKGIKIWNRCGNLNQLNNSDIGLDFSLTGSVTYEKSRFGMGVDTPGGANYPSLSYDTSIYPVDDFTVELWWVPDFDRDGTDPAYGALAFFGIGTGANNMLFANKIQNASNKYIQIATRDSATWRSDYSFNLNNYSAGDLQHFAFIFTSSGGVGGKLRLFQNGVEISGTPAPSRDSVWNITGTHTLYIGKQPNATGLWGSLGPVDNFKLFDRVKTDFSDRFNEGFGGQKRRVS
jgi:hypothetical protein